jgi:cytoskeletal protein CcmA (bactofilin family)
MAAAAAPPTPSATPPPDRVSPLAPTRDSAGVVRDVGAARHDVVRAARWTSSGSVKVTGDASAGEVALRGLATIGGRLTAERLTSEGTLEVLGAVDVRSSLSVGGTFRPVGTVHLGAGEVRGTLRAVAPVKVDRELRVRGVLEAPSLEVGLLDLEGSARVPGAVVARAKVRAQFRGDSTLGTVTAPEVVLRGPAPGLVPTLVRKVFGGSARVEVDRVEADRVELEAVRVAFVRSKAVVLGPGAHVAEVEGTIVRQHASARVGPESESPPPYGLSR